MHVGLSPHASRSYKGNRDRGSAGGCRETATHIPSGSFLESRYAPRYLSVDNRCYGHRRAKPCKQVPVCKPRHAPSRSAWRWEFQSEVGILPDQAVFGQMVSVFVYHYLREHVGADVVVADDRMRRLGLVYARIGRILVGFHAQ